MAHFRVEFDGGSKTQDVVADRYEVGDWIQFWQLQPDGTNIVVLTIRGEKVTKIEQISAGGKPVTDP